MGRDVRYIGSGLRLDLRPGRKDDPWKKKQYPKQSRQSVAHGKLRVKHSSTQALKHSSTQALKHSSTPALQYSSTTVLQFLLRGIPYAIVEDDSGLFVHEILQRRAEGQQQHRPTDRGWS